MRSIRQGKEEEREESDLCLVSAFERGKGGGMLTSEIM
jgi:hypothetical protein